jgi:hypothetical protein
MVELGRLDIYVNVALLSLYLTAPRKGHLEAIYCIYGYLKGHFRSTMVFDDAYLNWSDSILLLMIGQISMGILVRKFH